MLLPRLPWRATPDAVRLVPSKVLPKLTVHRVARPVKLERPASLGGRPIAPQDDRPPIGRSGAPIKKAIVRAGLLPLVAEVPASVQLRPVGLRGRQVAMATCPRPTTAPAAVDAGPVRHPLLARTRRLPYGQVAVPPKVGIPTVWTAFAPALRASRFPTGPPEAARRAVAAPVAQLALLKSPAVVAEATGRSLRPLAGARLVLRARYVEAAAEVAQPAVVPPGRLQRRKRAVMPAAARLSAGRPQQLVGATGLTSRALTRVAAVAVGAPRRPIDVLYGALAA